MNDLLQKEREELIQLLNKMPLSVIDKAILLDWLSAHDKRVLKRVGEVIEKQKDKLQFMSKTDEKAIEQTKGYRQALSDLTSLLQAGE